MIFAIAGDVDPEKMLMAIQTFAGDVPPGRVPSHDIDPEPAVLTPRTSVATFPKLGQAKLQLAFPSVRIDSPDLYALDLLATILGSGESSILTEELRDKKQLVSTIAAGNPTPSYVEGSLQVDMELAPEKIAPATEVTLALLDEITKKGVDAERLQRAKTQMRANRVKSLQTSENVAASMATDFMNSGDPHFSDRYVHMIEQVTADQVKDVATRYLVKTRLLTTALMPAEYVGAGGLPKAEDLLRAVAPTTREAAPEGTKPVVTRSQLPNGAILLHKRIATSPLVVIKMLSLGGVTAEDEKTNGLGNLTMEMLPRGTKTRNAQQIAEFFDSIGGELDTTCGNNSWGWTVTCMKGDFDKAIGVLGDVVNNPEFPEAEITPMKQRIAAQIDSQDSDWFQQAMRFFKKSYFGPKNEPYQFLPTGTKENVTTFTRDQMKQWYSDKALQGRRVIAIYGDVDADKAQSLAREHLGVGDPIKHPNAPTTKRSIQEASAATKPSVDVQRVETNKTDQPLAGIIIGYNADSTLGDPANFPIDVADTMCSGYRYPTGYIFEILRGRGLVYMADAQNWPGRDSSLPGAFFAYAGCDPTKVNEVIDLMLENIARLQGSEKDMQPGWFQRSQQLITTSDAMENETPAEQAQTAALDEMNGLGYDYHDSFAAKINAVKLDDVRSVAAKRLNTCVITVSTPNPDGVKVKPGMRTYESFPPVDLTPRGVQHDTK
jgi:zinc protease